MSEIVNPEHREPDPRHLQIEPHRHLIDDKVWKQTGITEYFDTTSQKRIMTLPRDSESAALHGQLVDKRISVYPMFGADNQSILLGVPNDSRTVQSSLRFIARDVVRYKEIFTQVGNVLGRCALYGLGLPGRTIERPVLASVAFSLNTTETFGGNVHLLPPYSFEHAKSKTEELQELRRELVASSYISSAVASELIAATSLGWEHARERS